MQASLKSSPRKININFFPVAVDVLHKSGPLPSSSLVMSMIDLRGVSVCFELCVVMNVEVIKLIDPDLGAGFDFDFVFLCLKFESLRVFSHVIFLNDIIHCIDPNIPLIY